MNTPRRNTCRTCGRPEALTITERSRTQYCPSESPLCAEYRDGFAAGREAAAQALVERPASDVVEAIRNEMIVVLDNAWRAHRHNVAKATLAWLDRIAGGES